MSLGQTYMNDFTVPGLAGMFDMPNAADSGMPYLNQMSQYFQPYSQAGQNALPQLQQQYGMLLGNGANLQSQYNKMMSNPGAVMNGIGAGFQQSPGYQFQTQQAEQAANHASAAGGMLGSPQQQQQIAGTVNNLANQDYYNYLNHGLGLYSQGLQGATNMYGMGLQGMGDMAHMGLSAGEDMGSGLMTQANLAYAGQADQNQAQRGMFGNMMGMIGAFA
jgi:hypothetical protein